MPQPTNILPYCVLFSVFCLTLVDARAQSPSPQATQSSSGEAELQRNLLDLLNPSGSARGADENSNQVAQEKAEELQESPGTSEAANPLYAIRQDMQSAAKAMRLETSDKSLALQQQIVDQLDTLIEQLSSSSRDSQNSRTSQQKSARQQNSRPASQETAANQGSAKQEDEGQPSDPGTGGATSSQSQLGANSQDGFDVGLDPRALQQSVWGQLPQRVRRQMQSRMVEQFLPSYRKQIEAYFQALLNE
ncbi:MAG: hypothetical protein KDB22_09335 [Planctomycetales bacterium]|nr:hypothetical protein [Planctomycetales bacterium]